MQFIIHVVIPTILTMALIVAIVVGWILVSDVFAGSSETDTYESEY